MVQNVCVGKPPFTMFGALGQGRLTAYRESKWLENIFIIDNVKCFGFRSRCLEAMPLVFKDSGYNIFPSKQLLLALSRDVKNPEMLATVIVINYYPFISLPSPALRKCPLLGESLDDNEIS